MSQPEKFLSSSFLNQEKYKRRPKSAGRLFEVTFLNKYAWWLEDKGRRETWAEACARVTEYNMSLYQGPASREHLIKEAELLFDKMYDLETEPAGRTLRIGGTPACFKFPEMNFNCSFVTVDDMEALVDSFHMSLCSVGLGYRVLIEDVSKLEGFCEEVLVDHEDYKHDKSRREYTSNDFIGYQGKYPIYKLTIGDSKEAWVEALRVFLLMSHAHSFDHNGIKWVINYDFIRPEGERIKTAGGFAAGHKGMQEMFTRLGATLSKRKGKLNPVAAMDSQNIVGKNVVTGGNRRAAQIALGSPEDEEFITAKKNLYTRMEDGSWKIPYELEHRKMSNNSVVFQQKPSWDELCNLFETIKNNGEPGFFNLEAARLRRPNVSGLNPCAEILLASRGVCNLSTVNMVAHLYVHDQETGEKWIDYKKLEESCRLATRIGLRQTNVTLSLPKWDEVQKRDRLIGPSYTGMEDMLDRLPDYFREKHYPMLLQQMNRWENDEADRYAYEMRVPRPLLVTAVKPEGTISQLPTVSSGLHRAFAPYYIRRMSVTKTDPLNWALKELGVPWEKDGREENSTREIFLFPVETGAPISAYDEPARDQLNRYFLNQRFYTDHNSSCTIYVGSGYDGYDDEWDEVIQMVWDNWDQMVAVSFLPKHSLENPPFPQMPYEWTSKENYDKMMETFPDLSKLGKVVAKYEKERTEFYETSDACAGGYCPTA
jgi:ribonucleoside-diphosphate reductase alpha chain/ribonucleoside-triphosphate reductase